MTQNTSSRLMNRTLNEEQLSWAIRFLFGISVFLIVILSFSYHSINRKLIYFSERVDHSHQVLDKLNEVRVDVYEVTYYGRGYLIAGDSANRRDLLKQATRLPQWTTELDTLLTDNKAQVLKNKALRQVMIEYSTRINRFATENPLLYTPTQRTTLLMNGSSYTKEINTILDFMAEIEHKLMESRVQSRNNYKQQIFRFNWVIMGVALAFLVASFILLERELKRNKLSTWPRTTFRNPCARYVLLRIY